RVEADVRREHLERGEGADHDDRARHGIVVLGQALLDRVAEHDQQDQVERAQRRQLAAPDDPRHEDEEEVQRRASDREVHGYGKTKIEWRSSATRRPPSRSVTLAGWRPTFVGFTWNCMKRT